MSEPLLTLYVDQQFVSPYAMFAFVVLTEKGIPFETRTVDLNTEQQLQPAYRDRSLTARVPSLVHDEFSLSESSAIVEYLDEAFGPPTYPPVLPQDILDRARARQVQAWLRSDLAPLRHDRPTTTVFCQRTAVPLSEEGRRAADKLIRVADTLLATGAQYLFDKWCIADTELALMLNRLALNGDPVPEKLRLYAAAQWQRPSVQQWIGRTQD